MIENSIGLSQQLNSRSYNEYLSRPMQNTKANPNAAMQAQSPIGQQGGNILDSMGFASELRSQKTVSALMRLNNPKTGFGPTLSEKGVTIDRNGNMSMPKQGNTAFAQENGNANTHATNSAHSASPANSASPAQSAQSTQNAKTQITEEVIGIPMNGRNRLNPMTTNTNAGLPLEGMRIFALDDRSLGVLSRITKKKENSLPSDSNLQNAVGKNTQSDKSVTTQASIEQIKVRALDGDSADIGKLAARYESSTKGSNIIGYDRNGGTSYGTYQISSKAGTFKEFLNFLDKEAPDWAQQLRDAGKANTGSRYGKVPDAWKKLCVEDPEQMKKLEHDFIVKSHYEPVAAHVEEKWKGTISRALHEVIFSTAVQHGVRGAKRVFNQAFADTSINEKTLNAGNLSAEAKQAQEELIKNVYSHRSTKFGSSTLQVQEAARNRFISEQKVALNILA